MCAFCDWSGNVALFFLFVFCLVVGSWQCNLQHHVVLSGVTYLWCHFRCHHLWYHLMWCTGSFQHRWMLFISCKHCPVFCHACTPYKCLLAEYALFLHMHELGAVLPVCLAGPPSLSPPPLSLSLSLSLSNRMLSLCFMQLGCASCCAFSQPSMTDLQDVQLKETCFWLQCLAWLWHSIFLIQ